MDIEKLIKQGTYPRDYRKCTLKFSVSPPLAYAMNFLAGLNEKDRVLDPFCGSGTILIERQLLKPCICVGVDIDPGALDCTRQNIAAAGVEIELKHGDIREKKFSEGYFTKIISNLPFGIQSGSRAKNVGLYRFLADNSAKWLKVGGKAVFLTNAKSLLRNCFAFNPSWELLSETPMESGGLHLAIFVYQKIS